MKVSENFYDYHLSTSSLAKFLEIVKIVFPLDQVVGFCPIELNQKNLKI